MGINNKYNFLIVGAGLYGASLARELTDGGKTVLVVERRPHIGGNAFTEDIGGICVHRYGPHIFHTDNERVWDFARRFAVFNDFVNEPRAAYKGRMYSLPFNMNTFRELWGVTEPEEAAQIIRSQISRYMAEHSRAEDGSDFCGHPHDEKAPANLEEKAISLVGTEIYDKLIRGYTEKQWGRPCTELPADIITRIPVRYEYNNRYFSDKYQGIPEDGYTAMISRMLENADVLTGTDYLAPENRGELSEKADRIVFSGQIDEYYGYCFGHLEYRGLRFETERISGRRFFQSSAVVNYTDAEVPWTRIAEHRHFTAVRTGEHSSTAGNDADFTVITREYPCEWKYGDDAYYPVRDDESLARYEQYRELASREKNVYFGGRLGSYRYYDMDDVIAAALEDADRLISRNK